jgi:UDP-N-acetylmuramyl tripeptide synthase
LALDKNLLSALLRDRDLVVISGTNGKTTTTALAAAAIGGEVVSNVTGSNMPAGLVGALVHSRATTAVLEVDEPYLEAVMAAARSAHRRVGVLLNLSRDQLDRASEVRQLADRWRDALAQHHDGWTLIANVSDPLVAYAVESVPSVVAVALATPWTADAASCPHCRRSVHYFATQRCHCHDEQLELPTWCCDCGFAPKEPAVLLANDLHINDQAVPLALQLPGGFNRANAVMAVVAASALGVAVPDAIARVSRVQSVAGRFAVRTWRGRTFRLMLAKNPAGVTALTSMLRGESRDVVVAINARVADGKDPSWIYDAPFDVLEGRHVWCDGDRSLDIASRLDYAGLSTSLVRDNENFPAQLRANEPTDVIANYTAFAEWLKKSEPC